MTPEDGERVSALLQRQVQPLVDADSGETTGETQTAAMASAADSGSGNNDNTGSDSGSGDDLDPETQAQLAEATQRAQRDLEALVRALREQEGNN